MSLLPLNLFLVLCAAALFTGFIKAGVPSLGALLSACVAIAFPARDALGITLLYLLAGDCIAVSLYWRQAHWAELKKMLLPVLLGLGSGALLLAKLDNHSLGLAIGLVVIILVVLEPFRPALTKLAFSFPITARASSGILAGIATTIGNASGPILALYFLLLKLDKKAFVGTGSIFFLFVNLVKTPIFIQQGIFKQEYFATILLTLPLVVIGAVFGKKFLEWIPQHWFNRIVLTFTAIAGLWLVLAYFS